ncbi:PL29 family lyase N-terminal domain-containing protein [Mucilaginibacter myungsuensis]|uniref:DUF4988 domain-containing protein n=1 Tax=Mucilaginibacter myungsuensis TaxID=649104 RepID=A0A929KVT3_9SPHI|nr:PL29 family lyase N-terminal domain-containing protein [Mucilaginibacter myungsuensis]MBE9661375.1 hypothetical protein [Mucilaginibacter myungsuensis]MDN3597518.1 PL29 family lyase N-terminal domain-containing protein [Mucilaginibacter myungsuensis]
MKRSHLLSLLFAASVAVTSCQKGDINQLKDQYADLDSRMKQQQEDLKNYKALLDALNAKVSVNAVTNTTDGYIIKLSDGRELTVKNGTNGTNGNNGTTPQITVGANGNWFVNGTDTGNKAQGTSPQITIGTNGNWFINGVDTGNKAKGDNGSAAPKITSILHVGDEIIFLFDSGESMKMPFAGAPNALQPKETVGVYMLCEGTMDADNSAISYYDIKTGQTIKDCFRQVNGHGLGETASDLKRYGSKMYCVVSGIQGKSKSFLEVIDVTTGKSLKRIPFFDANGPYMPRYVGFYKNKAYVSSYDGKVTRIDTTSLKIEARLNVGGALEGLAVVGSKLYVANSSHPLHPSTNNNTVSVVDLNLFSKMYDIPVTFNPVKIAATSNGSLLVSSAGDYATIQPALTKINSLSDDVVKTYPYNVGPMALSGNTAYLSLDWGGSFKTLNLKTDALGSEFIADGTSVLTNNGITVNPQNGDVYVADGNWYDGNNGFAYCFGTDGKKKFQFNTAGMPQHAVFVYSYK